MDPVTTAILSAITAAASKAAGAALEDAFAALKAMIRSRYGRDSRLDQAVKQVERNPSQAQKERLVREVQAAGADADPALRNVANDVLYQVHLLNSGQQIIQRAEHDAYLISGKISADRGSSIRIGGNDTTHNSFTISDAFSTPHTFLGWLITLPGIASFLIGFLIFGLTFADLISNPPPPGADMPEEFGVAFRFVFIGGVVMAIGTVFDRLLSRGRRK